MSFILLLLATAIGIAAFFYPFLMAPEQSTFAMTAHSEDASLVFLVAILLCLIVVIVNLETRQMNSKSVAILGILVAVNSVLRLVPGPMGFSAVFFLPILCGYVYGPEFGFLLGTLSLMVSAIVTSGMGPWLPYQMFATGWMGMAAAWLPDLSKRPNLERIVLAIYGAILGLVFGAVMDLWFWPYLFDPRQMQGQWQPGYEVWTTVAHFAIFYAATSLWWDLGRAAGNLVLILLFGPAILRLLRRFKKRFSFVVT